MAEEKVDAPSGETPSETKAAAAVASDVPGPSEDWATRFKYLLADFENFRKRSARERDTLRAAVRLEVVRSFIPLYEAAERARAAVSHLAPTDPIRRGLDLLVHEWEAVLDTHHVYPTALAGEPFHSEWHEAVAEAPVKAGTTPGLITEVVQQGYRIDHTLLRTAKVVVTRATPEPPPHEEGATTADPKGSG
jgi:molecular chaperone GrpE